MTEISNSEEFNVQDSPQEIIASDTDDFEESPHESLTNPTFPANFNETRKSTELYSRLSLSPRRYNGDELLEQMRLKRQQEREKLQNEIEMEKQKMARMILEQINESRSSLSPSKEDRSLERYQAIQRKKQEKLQQKHLLYETKNTSAKLAMVLKQEKLRANIQEKQKKQEEFLEAIRKSKANELQSRHQQHDKKITIAQQEQKRRQEEKQSKLYQIEKIRQEREDRVRKYMLEKEQYEKETRILLEEKRRQRVQMRQTLDRLQKSPDAQPPAWLTQYLDEVKDIEESSPSTEDKSSRSSSPHKRHSPQKRNRQSPQKRNRQSPQKKNGSPSKRKSGFKKVATSSLPTGPRKENQRKLSTMDPSKVEKLTKLPYWDDSQNTKPSIQPSNGNSIPDNSKQTEHIETSDNADSNGNLNNNEAIDAELKVDQEESLPVEKNFGTVEKSTPTQENSENTNQSSISNPSNISTSEQVNPTENTDIDINEMDLDMDSELKEMEFDV